MGLMIDESSWLKWQPSCQGRSTSVRVQLAHAQSHAVAAACMHKYYEGVLEHLCTPGYPHDVHKLAS